MNEKKLRRIEIKTSKLAEEIFSGEYRSGFRGKGMEFENIRLYVPGDDVRNIDWNVTARQDKTYTKQFRVEREMNIYLLIDMSGSNSFGKKREMITELSATLAFSAIQNNDRVGAVFFTDKPEKFIESKSGKRHVLSIIESILNYQPQRRGTSIMEVLKYFGRIEKKRSVVFLISDYLDYGYEKEMKIASKRHDLIGIRILDRAEERIPSGAIFTFEDLENGEEMVMDNLRDEFSIKPAYNPKMLTIYTDEDYIKPLKQFFKKRRL